MADATIIGVDLAKRVFQVHGAAPDGSVVFRKKLARGQLMAFLDARPRRAADTAALREAVRKAAQDDAADAEAIAEAASRSIMCFVPLQTAEQQAPGMIFRTRDLLVRQRTPLVNALRGHLAEHTASSLLEVRAHLGRLAAALDDESSGLVALVRQLGWMHPEQIATLEAKIGELDARPREAAASETPARLQTLPGIGPVTAVAIACFAPPMPTFRRGHDFAAWLGLVPLQRSTGGRPKLGKTSKMGRRDIRRLLIVGAMAVIGAAQRKGGGGFGPGSSDCSRQSQGSSLP